MAKDPAFLFYYQDWAYGTRKMTFEEKGAYMELLCEQADAGHLTKDDIKRTLKDQFPIWERICNKFKADELGYYYNEPLENHMTKRKSYVNSRIDNLKGVHKEPHMGNHMLNVNVNENKDVSKDVKRKKKALSDDEFIGSLKNNQAYKHINIEQQLGMMDAWILANPGRQKTRRFIVAWLNRIEKPMGVSKPKGGSAQPTGMPDIEKPKNPISPEKLKELILGVTKKRGVV